MSTPWHAAWDSAPNARRYAEFCRSFPLYREASDELAQLAGLERSRVVVDLACGTGASTSAILSRVPVNARVIAVDASPAMLAEARRQITDARVQWVHATADRLVGPVKVPVDAVICNAAIWQMELEAAFEAVRAVMRTGGSFVFDIGAQFVRLPNPSEDQPARESLFHLLPVAIRELYHVEPPPRRCPPLEPDQVEDLLRRTHFEVEPIRTVENELSVEAARAWLSIPIFTEHFGGGLTYEQRMAALDVAWNRLDRRQAPAERIRSVIFAAAAA